MTYRKTVVQFASVYEARAHFVKQGYITVYSNDGGAIMSKHVNGEKVGEVVVNCDAPMTYIAEKLEKSI